MNNSSPIAHTQFVIERSYPSRPQKVFAAFADPVKKRRWFAEGEGFTVDSYELDFRVGGSERARFRFVGNAPIEKGTPMGNDTVYHDIIPNQRIIFSYAMTMSDKPFSVSLATVEFHPSDLGTRMIYTEQSVFLENSDGAELRERGCRELFEALAAELTNIEA